MDTKIGRRKCIPRTQIKKHGAEFFHVINMLKALWEKMYFHVLYDRKRSLNLPAISKRPGSLHSNTSISAILEHWIMVPRRLTRVLSPTNTDQGLLVSGRHLLI